MPGEALASGFCERPTWAGEGGSWVTPPLLGSPVNPAKLCFGPWKMGSAGAHGELVPSLLPRPALGVFLVAGRVGFQGK